MRDAHNTYRRKWEQPEVGIILGRHYQQGYVHSLSVYAERMAETEKQDNPDGTQGIDETSYRDFTEKLLTMRT